MGLRARIEVLLAVLRVQKRPINNVSVSPEECRNVLRFIALFIFYVCIWLSVCVCRISLQIHQIFFKLLEKPQTTIALICLHVTRSSNAAFSVVLLIPRGEILFSLSPPFTWK